MSTILREAKKPKSGPPERRPLKSKAKAKITQADLAKGKKPAGVSWKDWLAAGGAFGGASGKKPKMQKPKKAKQPPGPAKYVLKIVDAHNNLVELSRWKRRWGTYSNKANIGRALASLRKEGVAIPDKVKDAFVVRTADNKIMASGKGFTIPKVKVGSSGKKSKKDLALDSLIAADPLAGDDWGDDDWGDDKPWWKSKPMGHWTGGKGSFSSKYKPKPAAPLTPEQKKLAEILKKMVSPIPRQAAGGVVFKTFEADDVWQLPVLLAQTAQKYGGKWVFPKGGVDPGESLKQGAIREVREEAGVKAKVVDSAAYKIKSKFHDVGKYDITRVLAAAKKAAGKADEAFVDEQVQALCRKGYLWENETHYFVMKHTGGKPNPSHVDHSAGALLCTNKSPSAEMQDVRWVTLAEAAGKGGRLREVIEHLLRTIVKHWQPPKGVKKTKPKKLSALRKPKKMGSGPRPHGPAPKKPHGGYGSHSWSGSLF